MTLCDHLWTATPTHAIFEAFGALAQGFGPLHYGSRSTSCSSAVVGIYPERSNPYPSPTTLLRCCASLADARARMRMRVHEDMPFTCSSVVDTYQVSEKTWKNPTTNPLQTHYTASAS